MTMSLEQQDLQQTLVSFLESAAATLTRFFLRLYQFGSIPNPYSSMKTYNTLKWKAQTYPASSGFILGFVACSLLHSLCCRLKHMLLYIISV